MIVTLLVSDKTCLVTKEEGDRRYHHGYAEPESTFLYDVLQKLKTQGHDVIKKRMSRDGHMVDDTQQYIRSRNTKRDGAFCIRNNMYYREDAGLEFNKLPAGMSYALYFERI